MTPSAHLVRQRLRRASDLSDLSADKRLDAKIDLSPPAVRARLVEASDLLSVCLRLARAVRVEKT